MSYIKDWAKGMIPISWGKAFYLVVPILFTGLGIKLQSYWMIFIIWISFFVAYTIGFSDDRKEVKNGSLNIK